MSFDINKRHILFLHAGAELYGADKILLVLVSGLVNRGWHVTVVVPWHGELNGLLEGAGAEVVVINHGVLRRKYMNVCGLMNRARLIYKAARLLVNYVKVKNVSIIHSNTSVVFSGALLSKLVHVPHIWHIHEITTKPRVVSNILSSLIPRLSSRVVCVSHAVLSHLIAANSMNAAKGKVIHNGIEPLIASDSERNAIRQELSVSSGDVLVGMVGRVNSWKGQMSLLDAAEIIITKYDNVKFLLVGGTFLGEEYLLDELNARIRNGVLADRVRVLSYRKDIPQIMSALDVFVLPSTQPDPLPTVVLEAMSLGRPIIGFAHGGICEMVENGVTGLLVPPCSVDLLSLAIDRLVSDKDLRNRLGVAGYHRFRGLFSVQAFINEFESIYEDEICN